MEILLALVAIAFIAVAAGIPLMLLYYIGQFVFGRIDRLGRASLARTRFHIIDYICLMVELQLVLGAFGLLFRDRSDMLIGAVLITLGIIFIWYKGVQRLSRAGIQDHRRRAVFNWIVVPVAYPAIIALLPIEFVFLVEIFNPDGDGVSALLAVLAIVLPLAILGCGLLTNWVAQEALDAPIPIRPSEVKSRAEPLSRKEDHEQIQPPEYRF
jgi:hypothetical protein